MGFNGISPRKNVIYWDLVGFNGIYPLVNVYIAMEKNIFKR
jgi:hypothetical protein